VERSFTVIQPQPQLKQREIFLLEALPSLLKLVYNLKHLSCKQFHNIGKGITACSRNCKIFMG